MIVTQLPVTRCQICHRTVAYRPGSLSEVLTQCHLACFESCCVAGRGLVEDGIGEVSAEQEADVAEDQLGLNC